MCGLYGVVTGLRFSEFSQAFEELGKLLSHRGPDGHGVLSFEHSNDFRIYLGHHRLSINDLDSRANQPLKSKLGSTIIVNGEIYNAKALRDQLQDKFEFRTNSDSEVALAVLEIFGQQGVSKLDGMFAFAFVPANGSEVWLGRDRLGIKPLYYSRDFNNFWFSSEAQPLAKILSKGIDEVAMEEWAIFQFIVSERSMFENIFPVPPGNLVIFKNNRIQKKCYWNFDDFLPTNTGFEYDINSLPAEIENLISASVESHLLADVGVATLTSGGIDSSVISALAAKLEVRQAYMGRYEFKEFDESQFAQSVADFSNLNLSVITIDSKTYFQELKFVSKHIDYPTAGPGAIGQSIIAREVSKKFKVLLSGTGGDELFLGYIRDRFPLIAAGIIDVAMGRDSKDWGSISGNIENFAGYGQMLTKFAENNGFQSPLLGFLGTLKRTSGETFLSVTKDSSLRVQSELLAKIAPNGATTVTEIHESLLRYEMKHFLPSLLHVEDRVSMAHGVEARVPFLDTGLVEFVMGLPLALRTSGTRPKDVLRGLGRNLLPENVLSRSDKMGFPVPLHKWIQTTAFHEIEEVFDILSASDLPIISKHKLLSPSHLAAESPRELWGAITLGTWLKNL